MQVGNVSFGNVVAVAGKTRNMKKFSDVMYNHPEYKKGNVLQFDISDDYRYAARNGLIAQAAQRGERVEIYVTGEDKQNFSSMKGSIMDQLTKFVSVDKFTPEEAVRAVLLPGQRVR